MTRRLLCLALVLSTLFAAACGGDKKPSPSQDAASADASDDGAVIGDAAVAENDAAVAQDAAVTSDAGQDAGPTTDCHGSRSCDGLVGLQCALAGCQTENNGTCGGSPAACNTYNGWGGAGRCFIAGCDFNVGNQKCTGSPKACADVNIFACGGDNGVAGCTPSGACSGEPTPCSDDLFQSQLACQAQPGCSWH